MTGNNVVADSSVIIDLMKGDIDVTTKFQSFTSVFITPIILSELLFGAYRSAQPAKNIAKIRLATSKCMMLTIDEKTAERFVDIKLLL